MTRMECRSYPRVARTNSFVRGFEQHNVADQHPDVVKRLQQLADEMRQDLGDGALKMPGKGRHPPGKV
jgi:hypothetical protein